MCRVLDPARRCHNFERERGGHQELGQQLVRVERDRGHERVELFRAERLGSGRRLGDGGRVRLGQHVERECRVEDQATCQNPYKPASHASSGNV